MEYVHLFKHVISKTICFFSWLISLICNLPMLLEITLPRVYLDLVMSYIKIMHNHWFKKTVKKETYIKEKG